MGIIERLAALAGTDTGKVIDLAHSHYHERIKYHGHHGRAFAETIAEVCRRHPNMVGIFVGFTVEQLLLVERQHHDHNLITQTSPDTSSKAPAPLPPAVIQTLPTEPTPATEAPARTAPHPAFSRLYASHIDASEISSVGIGLEVFSALVILKFSTAIAKTFGHKDKPEVWFAPAAKIHLFSGSLAAYYIACGLKAKKVSAWRNAAIGLFGTDALKPLLKAPKGQRAYQVAALPKPGQA